MAAERASNVFEWQREHALFPTMVFQHKVRDAARHNAALRKAIYALRKRDGACAHWQSGDRLHEQPAFRPLVDWIGITVPNIARFMGWDVDAYVITAMWANVLQPGESHQGHTHPNNFLSGVYYVQSKGDDAGKRIHFIGPATADRVLVPKRAPGDKRFTGEYSFPATEGTFLIFPSWLWHYVARNDGRDDRISISWNILIRGEVGAHENLDWAEL